MTFKLLLVLHAALAVALLGASVHNAVLGARTLFGLPVRNKLVRLYPKLALVLGLITTLAGAIVYPEFRVEVRAAYLDQALPWASAAFEVKEHLVLLALALLGAQVAWGAERSRPWGASAAVLSGAFFVYSGLVGLLLTTLRSV